MAGTGATAPDLERLMNESPSVQKKSGLLRRIISALLMLPVVIVIILQGGIIYSLFVALLTVLILYEWNGICQDRAFNAAFVFQTVFALMLVYSLHSGKYFDLYVYFIPVGLLVAACIYFRMKLLFVLLGLAYALLPAVSLIWIEQTVGGLAVLWMMIVVWSMDTGAYFAGKTIGGPRMAPRISPNKTWAGLVGGTVAAVILGLVSARYLGFGYKSAIIVPVTALLAIWSQIGDLAESALKRHFNVKDSGAIIPGHGGIMDRVDGVIFAAPAVVIFLYLLGMNQ